MADRLAAVRARTLANDHSLPYVELTRRALDPDAVRALPFELLERYVALPYELEGDVLRVAFAEPSLEAAEALARAAGRTVEPALAARDDVTLLLAELERGGTLRDEDLFLEG